EAPRHAQADRQDGGVLLRRPDGEDEKDGGGEEDSRGPGPPSLRGGPGEGVREALPQRGLHSRQVPGVDTRARRDRHLVQEDWVDPRVLARPAKGQLSLLRRSGGSRGRLRWLLGRGGGGRLFGSSAFCQRPRRPHVTVVLQPVRVVLYVAPDDVRPPVVE